MTYIIQRQERFYVVAYDGLDPLTGKERRLWHPAGRNRTDAEAIARKLGDDHTRAPRKQGPTSVASLPARHVDPAEASTGTRLDRLPVHAVRRSLHRPCDR
jgi:hypothetical protein